MSSLQANNYIDEYVAAIESGAVVVGDKVAAIYRKLSEAIRCPGKYVFDNTRATRPIRFIETFCKHSKGEWAGKLVTLELWQKAYISAVFGFVDAETGYRQYNETLMMVARKNGKSTLAAGILLYLLVADKEPGAELYTVATKKDQAALIFTETENMVKQSRDLTSKIRKRRSDLYMAETMGKIEALGKNSNTLDGLNSHGVVIDELHGVRDRNLYEVMKQSMSARRQPLLFMVTTAGTIRECIFDDIYQYAENVLNGVIEDEHFLPVIYELDKAEEYKEPDKWQKANPGLGTIKKTADLENKVNRAMQNPVDLGGVLVKDFNIRGTGAGAWLTFDDLNNTAAFDLADYYNAWAIGGADLSITTDLTAATLLMKAKDGAGVVVTQMYWLPADNLEKRIKEDKIPYDKWLERGLLRLCNGNTIDYADVTAWFVEMLEQYSITPAWVYYDSYSARYWVEEMQSKGFRMERCIQGAKTLSLPMQKLGADLQAKRVNYNNNPVLKWCLSNTAVQTDRNGNIVPIKNQNPKLRIDGLASLLDAYVGLQDHYLEFMSL